jgi:hypothetical protein
MGIHSLGILEAKSVLAQKPELDESWKSELISSMGNHDNDDTTGALPGPEMLDETPLEIHVGPDCCDCIDDFLLFNVFRKEGNTHEKRSKKRRNKQVEVKVTVSLSPT